MTLEPHVLTALDPAQRAGVKRGTRAACVAVSCMLATLASCASTGALAPGDETTPGTVAPDFTGRDVDGRAFRLSDHVGKQVVLLDFWATYCEPCKAELAHLEDLYAKGKPRGLLVVGIAMDRPD